MKRKNVLIVDDEKLFLKSVTDGLKPFQNTLNCNVLTAGNGKEAIAVLDATPVDLVITDIRMPEADGFKLITHIINNHASIPVVVMTAFGSQEIEKKVRELGIIRYLEKPVDFDQFLKTVEDVLSLDKREGRIEGIAISTFLQMMEMEKITCTLTIASKDRTANFYIKNGNLVEAEHGILNGVEAALEILTWDNVKINMKEICKIKEGSISQTLTSILLESFRRMDNKAKRHQEKEKEKEKTKEFQVAGTSGKQEEKPIIDVPRLNKAMEAMKKNLSGALIATDIFHIQSQQSVVGWNSAPETCAVFSRLLQSIGSRLKDIDYPTLNRYILLDLQDRKIAVILPLNEYQWCILVDGSHTQLGLLINLVIPQAIKAFQEAREK